MDEGDGLENRWRRKSLEGSNPSPPADDLRIRIRARSSSDVDEAIAEVEEISRLLDEDRRTADSNRGVIC